MKKTRLPKITPHRVNPDLYQITINGEPSEYTIVRRGKGWMVVHSECGDIPDWDLDKPGVDRPYTRYRDARDAALTMLSRDDEMRADAEYHRELSGIKSVAHKI